MQIFKKDGVTVFEMPHARVTLTKMPGDDVEIEVWPKAGKSAFAVVPQAVAILIANQLMEYSEPSEELPDNVIDLSSRMRSPKKNA